MTDNRWRKAQSYLGKGKNWIAVASLGIVAAYTVVTLEMWKTQIAARGVTQADDTDDREQDEASHNHEEALEAALRKSEQQKSNRWRKAQSYLDKGKNWIAVASVGIVAAYTVVTFEMWKAQIAANGINRDLYVASSRPWIMLANVKPASLTSDDAAGVGFWVDISVKNVGHSPAHWVAGRLLIDQFDQLPDQAMESVCQEARTYGYPGNPVFPDQTQLIQKGAPNSFDIPVQHVWAARDARIRSAYFRGHTEHAEAWARALSKFPFYAALYCVGCINYRSSDRRDVYQTSFMFGLGSFPLLSGEPVEDLPPTPSPSDPEVLVVHPRFMQRIVPGDQIKISTPLYGTFVR